MRHLVNHYKKRFPGCRVTASDSSFDAYDANGDHLVSLDKGGDGGIHCNSKEQGCKYEHDMSPQYPHPDYAPKKEEDKKE